MAEACQPEASHTQASQVEGSQAEAPQEKASEAEGSQVNARVASWVLEQAREPISVGSGSSSQTALPEIDTSEHPSESFNDCPNSERRKIAIIGGGISGFAAYWSLRETNHSVDLYEETGNLAGLRDPISAGSRPNHVKIDRSFMNFFTNSSPNLLSLLRELGIKWATTPCSFSVTKAGNNGKLFNMAFESIRATTLQKSNWRNFLDTLRLRFDIWKFHYFSWDLFGRSLIRKASIEDGMPYEWTMGKYLDKTGYSRLFVENYLLPMLQTFLNIGSENDIRALPAHCLISYLWSTGLLTHEPKMNIIRPDLNSGPRLRQQVPLQEGNKKIHLFAKIFSVAVVWRGGRFRVRLNTTGDGKNVLYDNVIFAVPAREALRLLAGEATELEKEVLGAFQTTTTHAWLHSDLRFLPFQRAYAYINWADRTAFSEGSSSPFCVTYRLDAFPNRNCRWNPLCVTFNPVHPPRIIKTAARWEFKRPLLNAQAVNARRRLNQIQNIDGRHLMFCGSWTGYGLPEDGVRSAFILTTQALGARLPFRFVNSLLFEDPPRPLRKRDHLIRTMLRVIGALFFICRIVTTGMVWSGDALTLVFRALISMPPRWGA